MESNERFVLQERNHKRTLEEYERTGCLTTRIIMGHTQEKLRRELRFEEADHELDDVIEEIDGVFARLNPAIEEFARTVWASWLKGYYREQDHRGLEANAGNVNVLVWGCAGRVMVSLRLRDWPDENHHVTLIGADGVNDTDTLGLQGISFNGEMTILLVQEATRLSDDISNDIRPNAAVGMG